MNILKITGFLALSTLVLIGSVFAQEIKIGDLLIINPAIRATPPNAPVSGGYLTIKNNGTSSEFLLGASVAFAVKAQLHEMLMQDEIMKMREVAGRIEITAGGEVVLKPGGLHVMFMKIDQQMKAGNHYKVVLKFQNAGEVEVKFHVKDIADIKKMMHNHNSMKMDGETTN